MTDNSVPERDDPPRKRPYSPPQLVDYGSVQSITLGSNAQIQENT
jgi:hypothetical protein